MVLIDRKVLQTEKEGYASIEIIPYHNFYYVLLKYSKGSKYRLFKISASGEYEDRTNLLKDHFSSALIEDNRPQNITKVQGQVFFVNHYFDQSSQKLFIRILSTDSLLLNKNERLITVDYKFGMNIVNKILFTDPHTAYITQSFRNPSPGYGQVDITRYDLSSGNSNQINLTSTRDNFSDPDLKFNSIDSSFFFLSRVAAKRSGTEDANRKRYYYVKMNEALEELSPSMLVQIKSSNNERVILTPGGDGPVFVSDNNQRLKFGAKGYDLGSLGISQFGYFGSETGGASTKFFDPKPVDIPARLDPNLKRTDVDMRVVYIDGISGKKSDLFLKSKKGKFKSQYYNSFMISAGHKYSLFFTNSFSFFRNGISYVTITHGKFSTEEFLKVDQKYEYILPLAKQVNEQSFIIPYSYKDQLGLVKVNLLAE